MESGRRGTLDSIVEHLSICRTFRALFAHFSLCQEKSTFFSKSKVRGALLAPEPPLVVL